MSVITKKNFNIDFLKWLMTETVTNSELNNYLINTVGEIAPTICEISVQIRGGIDSTGNPTPYTSYANILTPTNPIINQVNKDIPTTKNLLSTVGISLPQSITAQQINPSLPKPFFKGYVDLKWVNGAIYNAECCKGFADCSGITYSGNISKRCKKICDINYCCINSDVPLYFDPSVQNNKRPAGWGCRIGPAILSAEAQYIFAFDESNNIYLVGSVSETKGLSPAPPSNIFFNSTTGKDTYVPGYKYSDNINVIQNSTTFDFDISFNSINNNFLQKFIESNPKYLKNACLNNQNFDNFWSGLTCQTQKDGNNNTIYYRDSYDHPSKNCDSFISKYCNEIGKYIDSSFCGCYVDEIPDSIKNIINNNNYFALGLCKPPDLSGNIDNINCIPRECVLPSCMRGEAYKTTNQMNTVCPNLCSAGIFSSIAENGNVNYSNSKINLNCGSNKFNIPIDKANLELSSSSGNKKLSSGEIAGIVIGSIVGIILVIIIIIYITKKV